MFTLADRFLLSIRSYPEGMLDEHGLCRRPLSRLVLLYRSVQLSSDLVEGASERLFSDLPFVSCVLSSKLKFALQVYYWHTPSSTLRPSNHLPWPASSRNQRRYR